MKFHCNYSEKYIQDICEALNGDPSGKFAKMEMTDHFTPENYGSLTEFLQLTVLFNEKIYYYLDNKGLVNTGRCPYTGTSIDRSSASWNYLGRTLYVSRDGAKIMQEESEEDADRLLL